METFVTGWSDIPELRFDAATQTLTLVYRSGDTRRLAPVTRDGLDRFLGRAQLPAVLIAAGGGEHSGIIRQTQNAIHRIRARLRVRSAGYRGAK